MPGLLYVRCRIFLRTSLLIQNCCNCFSTEFKNKMRNIHKSEESFGSKYSHNYADYPCRFSASRRRRNLLCNQRRQHPSATGKPKCFIPHVWVDSLELLSRNDDNEHWRTRRSHQSDSRYEESAATISLAGTVNSKQTLAAQYLSYDYLPEATIASSKRVRNRRHYNQLSATSTGATAINTNFRQHHCGLYRCTYQLSVNDIGTTIGITVFTSQAMYYQETNVQTTSTA